MWNIKSRISKLDNLGEPEKAFLYANIQDWLQSPTRNLMKEAQKYYDNDSEIINRKRYYIDRKGVKTEAENLSNSKLAHPFMRKFVNQKVNFLLAKEFTIVTPNENFNNVLLEYMDKKFRRILKNVGRDAVINGIAWLQVYYDNEGKLSYKRIPSEEIIPFWEDVEHTVLSSLIRIYTITEYNKEGYKKSVNKVEYYTNNGVWYYVMDDDGLKPDPDMPEGQNLKGHFTVETQEKDFKGNPRTVITQANWDRIPFIAFKYNSDEMSLLKWVKPLIDDYDINTSDLSNNLQDVPNSIKVVRNFDGTDKGEFVQNLATFRTAFVSDDGDMTALQTPLDVASIKEHLDRLRKDVYDAANCVDTQIESLGNVTGVALKFRYAGLQMDANDMANEFGQAIDDLVWFMKVDMLNNGKGDFMAEKFDIIFNTDIIINESEVINDARNSVGIISDETIIANHPWVIDIVKEQDKLEEQRQEELLQQQEMMAMESQFGAGPDQPPKPQEDDDEQ